MNTVRNAAVGALALLSTVVVGTSAQAQMYGYPPGYRPMPAPMYYRQVSPQAQMYGYPPGYRPMPMPAPMYAGPAYGQPAPMYAGPAYGQPAPMYAGPAYGQPAPMYAGSPSNRPNPGMGVDLSAVGPMAGAGVTAGLNGLGVPAPISGWAGGRVNANAASAGREMNVPDAAVRTFTGISPRDIRENGLRGGKNSEVNKVLKVFGL